jgi:hypothetical protein
MSKCRQYFLTFLQTSYPINVHFLSPSLDLNALAPATNNAAAPPVGAASLGPNPLLHKTPSGRLVGLPSASVNFPNANNPAVPLVHNGSGTRSHFLPVQALPADNASGVDSGDEAGKSHDTSHLIGFGLGPIFPDHQMVTKQIPLRISAFLAIFLAERQR